MKVSLFHFLTVLGGLLIAIVTLVTLLNIQNHLSIKLVKATAIVGIEIMTIITSFIVTAMVNYHQPRKYRLEITIYRTLWLWLVMNAAMCLFVASRL